MKLQGYYRNYKSMVEDRQIELIELGMINQAVVVKVLYYVTLPFWFCALIIALLAVKLIRSLL